MALDAAAASRTAPLRLRAEDADDLAVISACLQDALVAVRDIAYDRHTASFLLVANRFRWETCDGGADRAAAGGAPFERTLCILAFAAVDSVAYRGFDRREEERILSLLAIRLAITGHPDGAVGGFATVAATAAIDLEFAGDATIRLLCTGGIRCRLRDVGDPWPTPRQPGHELDQSA